MTRLLLLGANGQLGHALAHVLPALGEVIAPPRSALDLADADALRETVRALRPRVVVNAAAHSAVDAAESDAAEADRINHRAPAVLAEELAAQGGMLMHYSTEYVFAGNGGSGPNGAYREDDPTGPRNVYGRTKLAGELAVRARLPAHLIFRTSWLYGLHGDNFITTMLGLMRERDTLQVVADQVGAPTPATLLVEATVRALRRCLGLAEPGHGPAEPPWGTWHVQAAGATTWHAYAEFLLAAFYARGVPGLRCRSVEPVSSAALARPAPRPAQGKLDCRRIEAALGLAMPDWRDALNLHLDEFLTE